MLEPRLEDSEAVLLLFDFLHRLRKEIAYLEWSSLATVDVGKNTTHGGRPKVSPPLPLFPKSKLSVLALSPAVS